MGDVTKAIETGKSEINPSIVNTIEWVKEKGMKARIHDFLELASKLPNNDVYYIAADKLVAASMDLCEHRCRNELAKDFGTPPGNKDTDKLYRQVNESIDTLRQIGDIPELDPDLLSYFIIKDYFENRMR